MATTPLSDGAEEFLSWLAVERGRAAQHGRFLPPGPAAYEGALAARGRIPASAGPDEVSAYLLACGRRP